MADKQDSVTDKASGNQVVTLSDAMPVIDLLVESEQALYKNMALWKGDSLTEFMYSHAPSNWYKIRLSQQDTRSTVNQDKRGKNALKKPKP